ncbi:MAG TPA: hypothetical protein VKZ59_08445 [Acidobacteriota bacterium]|nr:hypothetical protein [Acidobacteriota bacterium]
MSERLNTLNEIIFNIVEEWYERIKQHYVTPEESRELGVEPEIKSFHEFGHHRIKFARQDELDVTYGLSVDQDEKDGRLVIVSSVNNKSERFNYDVFVERLKSHYWRSRHEKPWTEPEIDRFAYGDLLEFEPTMGKSVALEIRKDKADIVKLSFVVSPHHEELLMKRKDLLRDLIENYCLYPLQRIYAESYRAE